MTSKKQLTEIWSFYFSTPFTEQSLIFWEKYPPQTIHRAFQNLIKRLESFETTDELCRAATAMMRAITLSDELKSVPLPKANTEVINDQRKVITLQTNQNKEAQ